jgi:hypothetical protein
MRPWTLRRIATRTPRKYVRIPFGFVRRPTRSTTTPVGPDLLGWTLALLCLLFCAAAASPAAADETIGEVADLTPVDAWAGRLAWSERDPATGRFQLMTRTSGAATRVPVDPRSKPFDVDLGPGPDGSTVAAYSRGGRLYLYDFGSGHERRLRGSGKLPSVWHGKLAWVSARRLFVRRLAGGAAREVRGGRGDYVALDLHGRRLAFVRVRPHGEGHEYQMLLQDGRGVAKLVDRAASGLLSIVEMMRPSFEGGGLYYAVSRRLAAGQRFLRYDLSTHRLREVVSRSRIRSAAFDRGRFFYLQTQSEGEGDDGCVDANLAPAPCLLRLSSPIVF